MQPAGVSGAAAAGVCTWGAAPPACARTGPSACFPPFTPELQGNTQSRPGPVLSRAEAPAEAACSPATQRAKSRSWQPGMLLKRPLQNPVKGAQYPNTHWIWQP